jgi:hypothetical protein
MSLVGQARGKRTLPHPICPSKPISSSGQSDTGSASSVERNETFKFECSRTFVRADVRDLMADPRAIMVQSRR